MSSESIEIRFEEIIKELFAAEGLKPTVAKLKPAADFEVEVAGNKVIVEVKLYRSSATEIDALKKSAAFLEVLRRAHKAKFAVLIVGNYLEAPQLSALERFPDIIPFDLKDLFTFAQKNPRLFERLELVAREATPFSSTPTLLSLAKNYEPSISDSILKSTENTAQQKTSTNDQRSPPVESKQGEMLCKKLISISSGIESFREFETAATNALKYIFENDLTAWSAQKHTDSNHSIYDLVARVSSIHDFWSIVATQFRSRYIVFEFKNTDKEIKQGHIYTTEKYLYGTALRATAIIVTRIGADKNAHAAIRGALREHGKLILVLNVEDICNMLKLRDRGDDHNKILTERLDEMLMKLER